MDHRRSSELTLCFWASSTAEVQKRSALRSVSTTSSSASSSMPRKQKLATAWNKLNSDACFLGKMCGIAFSRLYCARSVLSVCCVVLSKMGPCWNIWTSVGASTLSLVARRATTKTVRKCPFGQCVKQSYRICTSSVEDTSNVASSFSVALYAMLVGCHLK